ncbi:MAG: hypothetical protein HYY46_06420 [Deltaproteobacteria bacterium]|nr:hypothetical protein [Deltaproteobacteria bacterium]
MLEAEATDEAKLERAWRIGKEAGLRYVYCGNLPVNLHGSTHCYQCGRPVIERVGFAVKRNWLKEVCCPRCQAMIDGVWKSRYEVTIRANYEDG